MKTTNKDRSSALRILSADMVDKAKSGHPGAPLGMADIAEVLFFSEMKHNPANPHWFNRDRLILSNGHACALLYSLQYLAGYKDMTLDQLKSFRQLGSLTHGHPELGSAEGVELTTGPLGQGIANAVGMALAEKILASRFNKPDFDIIDNHIYTFVGEGCLMEGISHEACSLAGTLKLDKLIVLMDRNKISIDGNTDAWYGEDIAMRFRAYGFDVIENVDGHDVEAIQIALTQAKKEKTDKKPTLIIFNTIIGYQCGIGCGSESVHGSPLKEVETLRKNLDWEYSEKFFVPEELRKDADLTEKGEKIENHWKELLARYTAKYPKEALELQNLLDKKIPDDFDVICEKLALEMVEPMASRSYSQIVLSKLLPILPYLFGASADLTGSNLTAAKNLSKSINFGDFTGNYLSSGVREFGMFALLNGMNVYGGFIPYGGTFLVFLDYAKSALRSSAIMKSGVIYVLTHDSIGLGEDGTTHQPVEHLTMIRTTPNVEDWRPCNYRETMVAWQEAIKNRNKPTCLALSRQKITASSTASYKDIMQGGYIFQSEDKSKTLDIVIIATGSEVELAITAAKDSIKNIRIVSIPSFTRFFANDEAFIDEILPPLSKKIIIEAGSSALWYRVKGEKHMITMDSFGASGKAADLFKHYGFSVENVLHTIEN